jgi:hypothetical protein
MIRLSKSTRLAPEEILGRAAAYFGEGGEGLKTVERGSCCVSFAGGGGDVTVSVVDETTHRTVDVVSREFEYQAKRFLERV